MKNVFKCFLFVIVSCFCTYSFADNDKKIDSLKVLLTNANDSTKADLYNKIARYYRSDTTSFNAAISKSIEYAVKAGAINIQALAVEQIGRKFHANGNFEKAKSYFYEFLKLGKKSGDLKLISSAYSDLGNINYFLGNFDIALKNYFLALTISEKLGNKTTVAKLYLNIGNNYLDLDENKKSLFFQKLAYQLFEQLNDESGMSYSLSNLGKLYKILKNNNKAIECYQKGLKLFYKVDDKYGIGLGNLSLAQLYYESYSDKRALQFALKALEIELELNDPFQIANCYIVLGQIYDGLKQDKKALDYLNKAYLIGGELNARTVVQLSLQALVKVYKANSDFKNAFETQEKLITVTDSINSRESKDRVAEITGKYESVKKEEKIKSLEKDKKIQKLEIAKNAADMRRQRYILALVGGILILMVLFLFSLYKSNLQRKRANAKLQNAYNVIEEKKKEILDSITYAKRLQDAILPPQAFVSSHFKENFILYLPKDIVAGDFYWMEDSNGMIFIAAADSTGHCVPGAMVSVVCSNALNRAVNEFKLISPGSILNKTRDLVLETFGKASNDVKDGMDISLLCYDINSNKVFWSGANNPLWYFDSGALKKIVANKQPIGKTDSPTPFTTHEIVAAKGTTFYLFTDGFADQFGGSKWKKFKYRQLEDFLTKNANDPMEMQRGKLIEEFELCRGDLEQVDDVCIIGIRI